MSFKKIFLIACFITFSLVVIFFYMKYYHLTKSPNIELSPVPTLAPFKPKIIGWVPFWDQTKAFGSFSANTSVFDFVSVFWYRIDAQGKLATYKSARIDDSIISFAHEKRVKVLAVIANMPDYDETLDWDPVRVGKILVSPQTRKAHVDDIVTLVMEKDLDGVDIDYENLVASQKETFSLFIEELAKELHERGKLLGLAIHPKTGENNPEENYGVHAQDLVRISQAVDHMYFMTYTEHSRYSPPGPAGSIDWTKKVIDYAIHGAHVPASKIFMGVGLFGLEWTQRENGSFYGTNDDLTYSQIQSILENNSIEAKFDGKVKSNYFTYFVDGKKNVIWYENSQSVAKRLQLAKSLGVGGLAFWRLGEEDIGIWEEIKKLNPKIDKIID